jgi:hypothetical protein
VRNIAMPRKQIKIKNPHGYFSKARTGLSFYKFISSFSAFFP